MANEHSYSATLKNNKTESNAIQYLLESNKLFRKPTKEQRVILLSRLGLTNKFSRAFDLVLLPTEDYNDILDVPNNHLVLVELKTTQKRLTDNPTGFFFGATENEMNLAQILDHQFRFCFVSLHPESKGFVLLTLNELTPKIKTKRLQYQINL